VRNAPIGMLTGTIFPSSSRNGGWSLVPEKLSNVYLRVAGMVRNAGGGYDFNGRSRTIFVRGMPAIPERNVLEVRYPTLRLRRRVRIRC
jgi:hypothetical protein